MANAVTYDGHESETLEFKREVTKTFCREIVAFLNTRGGRILVGIDDDGTVLGVRDPDAEMRRIVDMAVNDVCPEIREFLSLSVIEVEGFDVVEVTVEEGDRKPYCIAQKGFIPAGVYVRCGSSNTHASVELIRSMILESDGAAYEERRCANQDLTFTRAAEEFRKAEIEFGPAQQRTLGLTTSEGRYTNLALLLSDQNPFSIRCAVFNDTRGLEFQSRKEFDGSLLAQIDSVLDYLDLTNRTCNKYEGARRIDRRDYPLQALREAILNSVVHRDYDCDGPVLIRVYLDRMEIVSLGGLVRGITMEDLGYGVSVSRNPKLAQVLYRLRLVEGYGLGIQTIYAVYSGHHTEPVFDAAPNTFVAILPNLNYGLPTTRYASIGAKTRKPPVKVETAIAVPGCVGREDALLSLASSTDSFTRSQASQLLATGRDATLAVLNKMVREGKLVKTGSTKAVRYALADPSQPVNVTFPLEAFLPRKDDGRDDGPEGSGD